MWKNHGLVQSLIPSFGEEFESANTTGPVNKLTPLAGESTAGTTGFFSGVKKFFGPVGGEPGYFGTKSSSATSGGSSGTYSTITQYAGVAAIGLAVGDFAGSVYNKRKKKRGIK